MTDPEYEVPDEDVPLTGATERAADSAERPAEPAAQAADPANRPAEPAERAAEPAETFPWPPADGDSLIAAWGSTWQGASLHPARFFRAMPRDTSFGAAIAYYLSIGIAVAGAALFWSMVTGGAEAPASAMPGLASEWSPVLNFLFSPVVLLLLLFVAAGFTHLLLLIFGAAGGGFGTTARVFCFAYSPQILGVIPVVGHFVGFVWMVGLAIIGLREAHRTSTARSAAAVLIPVAIGVFFIILGALIAAAGFLELPA